MIGLVGYCVPTGLGYESRRIWRNLPIGRWLIVPHKILGTEGIDQIAPREGATAAVLGEDSDVEDFLQGLSAIIAVERTFPSDLFAHARHRGIRCVLCVNLEWYEPRQPWFRDADVLIARTRQAERWLTGHGVSVTYLPCPIDLDELPFTPRQTADRIVFSNGWGGVGHRKGWPQVRDVLKREPGLLTVRTQRPLPDTPKGTTVLGPCERPADLYAGFDLACQPSRMEGVGLAILEAMACGAVVVTTDAEPMRDYVLAAYGDVGHELLVPARPVEIRTWQIWTGWVVDSGALYETLKWWQGRDIADLSRAGRAYVERCHGTTAWRDLLAAINPQGDA